MPEEVFETPQPTQPVTEPKTTNWPKIILAAVLGLGLLIGAAYAGYWYGTEPKTQIQETPTPEVTPSPTPTVADEIVGWETYTDTKYNYEINRPEGWDIESIKYQNTGAGDSFPNCEGVLFKDPNNIANIMIRIEQNPEGLNPISYFTRYPIGETAIIGEPIGESEKEQRKIAESMIKSANEVTVGDVSALRFENVPGPLPSTEVILLKENLVFRFMFLPVKLPVPDMYKDIFDQILSTFKFLD